MKVKYVDGSPMETHGVSKVRVELSNSSIVHDFQLVNKQVDIPCDGIFLNALRQKFVMNHAL